MTVFWRRKKEEQQVVGNSSISSTETEEKAAGNSSSLEMTKTLEETKEFQDENPFADPVLAKYYSGVYEKSHYEGRHLFDPDFTWEEMEEKKTLRKIDWRVTALAFIMFFALEADRSNIKQAISDSFLKDIRVTRDEYNYSIMISKAAYLAGEIPSGLVSKAVGPDRWLPIQIILWSIVATAQVGLKGKNSFYACRAIVGLLQGGFIADTVLWLSYFYTGKELGQRISIVWASISVCDILMAVLAYGLLHLQGKGGLKGWQYIFLVEGILTIVIGVVVGFFIVPGPAQTKKSWLKKGWFTDREEKIVINKILRDDPSKGDMNNRQAISFKGFISTLLDYDLWPIYFMGLIAYAAFNTVGNYFTLILKDLGYNKYGINLLQIPSLFLHAFTIITISWLAEITDKRAYICLISCGWQLLFLGLMRWWPKWFIDKVGSYLIVTFLRGAPFTQSINASWCSRNSNSIKSRTMSVVLLNMFIQAGGMYDAQIYRNNDKPLYHQGNTILFALQLAYGVLLLLTKFYYDYRNKQKDKKWNAMTKEEKADYIVNSAETGNRRLDFRFAN